MARARPSYRPTSWSRLLAVLPIAALTVAGCSATNPLTTSEAYAASDGVLVELGASFRGVNLLIISAAEGEPGVLLGGLTNRTDEDFRVTISPEGVDAAAVRVPADSTVLLGGDDHELLELDSVAVPPGAVLPVRISTPDGGSVDVSIPVLDGSLPEYADLVPTEG